MIFKDESRRGEVPSGLIPVPHTYTCRSFTRGDKIAILWLVTFVLYKFRLSRLASPCNLLIPASDTGLLSSRSRWRFLNWLIIPNWLSEILLPETFNHIILSFTANNLVSFSATVPDATWIF